MSQTSIERLLKELSQQEKNKEDMLSTENIREALVSVSAIASRKEAEENKTVFVSHRFAEQEYVEGLHRLLEQNGFKVITGKSANTYISKAVVTRIRKSQFFYA